MAKEYKMNAGQRLANAVMRLMTEHGLGADYRHMLCVRGRATGVLRSTPVDVMEIDGISWLVAPYGEVNWVRNIRAAGGHATLSRGKRTVDLLAEEVTPADAVGVIRTYLRSVPVTRAYWDVTADATDAQIAADGVHHPVFRLAAVAS